jgi:hypothetical protein
MGWPADQIEDVRLLAGAPRIRGAVRFAGITGHDMAIPSVLIEALRAIRSRHHQA